MLKDFQVDLELSPRDNRVIQTGATYWSHDVNTAKINIKLLRHSEPVILNKDVTVRVMMLFDDENKSEHIYTAKIEDEKAGIVSVILDKNVRSYVGQVICGVYADYGAEQKTDNGYFTFAMKRSLIDKRMPEMKQYYVSDFEDTLAKMKLTNAEFAEVETKLNGRIDKIEKDITSNEVVKETDFNQLQGVVTNLENEIDRLEIGGTNLLPDTNYSKKPEAWAGSKVSIIEGESNNYVKVERVSGSGTVGVISEGKRRFMRDETYTISFELRTTNLKNLDYCYVISPQETVLLKDMADIEVNKDNEWHKYTYTFTTWFDRERSRILIGGKDGESFDLRRLKLEKGNRPTDWSPAPEDLATKKDISNLQKQIDDLEKAITNLGGIL